MIKIDNISVNEILYEKIINSKTNEMKYIKHKVVRISKTMSGHNVLITSCKYSNNYMWFFNDYPNSEYIYNNVGKLIKSIC
tara:strand:- start:265 stop:507 length:243 start_codon:yes stop_codon:yes gene_type:complete